jgi:hypothetical protein
LEEELHVRFRDHSTYPRTVVIHATNAPIHLTAMVCSVRFPVVAFIAEYGESIRIAKKDVFVIKMAEPRRRRESTFENGLAVIGVR